MFSENEEEIVKQIAEKKWRQGSIFRNEQRKISELQDAIYLVITQDCDLYHRSFFNEPYVEVLECILIQDSKPNGSLTHGKNPRRIQFKLSNDTYCETKIHSRKSIDRKSLSILCPDASLSIEDKVLENIKDWLKKRYDRAAFPFEFDNRLNRDKLKKCLEKIGDNIIGVFVRLNTKKELSNSEIYKVDFFVLIENSKPDLDDSQEILEEIYNVLGANKGIEVFSGYGIKTTNDISVEDFRSFQKLDYDYLSFRDFPKGTII